MSHFDYDDYIRCEECGWFGDISEAKTVKVDHRLVSRCPGCEAVQVVERTSQSAERKVK